MCHIFPVFMSFDFSYYICTKYKMLHYVCKRDLHEQARASDAED